MVAGTGSKGVGGVGEGVLEAVVVVLPLLARNGARSSGKRCVAGGVDDFGAFVAPFRGGIVQRLEVSAGVLVSVLDGIVDVKDGGFLLVGEGRSGEDAIGESEIAGPKASLDDSEVAVEEGCKVGGDGAIDEDRLSEERPAAIAGESEGQYGAGDCSFFSAHSVAPFVSCGMRPRLRATSWSCVQGRGEKM